MNEKEVKKILADFAEQMGKEIRRKRDDYHL